MKRNEKQKTKPEAKINSQLTKGQLRSLGAQEKLFLRLWDKVQRGNINARYELGEFVRKVMGTYGDEGIKHLADKTGKSKTLIYNYAKVVELFDRGDLKTWLAKAEGKLEWSHLYTIAEHPGMTAERRDALLVQVIDGSLSARALKRLLGGDVAGEGEDELSEQQEAKAGLRSSSTKKTTFVDSLRAFDRTAEALFGKLDAFAQTLEAVGQLGEGEVTQNVVEQLAKDVATLDRLQDAIPLLSDQASQLLNVVRMKLKPKEPAKLEPFTVAVADEPSPQQHVQLVEPTLGGRFVEVDSAPTVQSGT